MILILVILQGLLGMWTVTLLVNPTIVTAHLAGGMATLALLWWLRLRTPAVPGARPPALAPARPWLIGGLGLVCAQILLGGWTSTHYAGLACTELPTCHGGSWWPEADFAEGFALFRPIGPDYELGRLDGPGRVAIHLIHRIGALTVLTCIGILAMLALRRSATTGDRLLAWALAGMLLVQVGLGIANVLGRLPLGVAVAHNGGAAVLLLILVTLIHRSTPVAARLDEPLAARVRSSPLQSVV